MTKSEFVDKVADQAGLEKPAPTPAPAPTPTPPQRPPMTKPEVLQVVDAIPSVLAEGLHADSEVTIDGLGTFSLDQKKRPKFRADPEFEAALIKIEDTGASLPEAER